ncbi:MAG: ImmA/IrrE family metallo-endopeptidase [Bacteroidales bacterium]|nr:ImmA/IrrE family metallo-endopeptidase [Bacteroidales bacterium]
MSYPGYPFFKEIRSTELDKVAEEILRDWFPVGLETPQAIPIRKIAEEFLQLKIISDYRLSANNDVIGAIALNDGIVDIYDDEIEQYVAYDISYGTILIDFWEYHEGRINNTIAHECVHWKLHRSYFQRQKHLEKEKNVVFRCPVTQEEGLERKNRPWTIEEKMEWQAKELAPRILMPRKMVIQIIEKNIKENNHNLNSVEDITRVVDLVAEVFQVSKQSASIRLQELGYDEAALVYNDWDYRPRRNKHRRWDNERAPLKKTPIKIKQSTYEIPISDAFKEFQENINFRNACLSGNLVFIENRLVINNHKYVEITEHGMQLTEYAQENPSKCALEFSWQFVRRENRLSKSIADIIFRYEQGNYKTLYQYDDSLENKEKYNKLLSEDMSIYMEERKQLVSLDFRDALVKLMDNRNITVEKLSELSQVGTKTIQRLRNLETYEYKHATLVAICIGLRLDFASSMLLFSKAGLTFNNSNLHNAYQFLLSICFNYSIIECNKYLEDHQFPSLGTDKI